MTEWKFWNCVSLVAPKRVANAFFTAGKRAVPSVGGSFDDALRSLFERTDPGEVRTARSVHWRSQSAAYAWLTLSSNHRYVPLRTATAASLFWFGAPASQFS